MISEADRARYLAKDNLHTAISTWLGLAARAATVLIVWTGIASALSGQTILFWKFDEANIGAAVALFFIGHIVVFAILFIVISILGMLAAIPLGLNSIPDEFYETTVTDYDRMRMNRRG